MVLEPPIDNVSQTCGGERASKKRRDMSVEHSADLKLSERYVVVRQQLHELMQDDTSSEGEGGAVSLPPSNTIQSQNTATSQQQVPSASANSGNKVRVRSGGSENGSSGSGSSGSKVVMM